jgi:hypothetical protein
LDHPLLRTEARTKGVDGIAPDLIVFVTEMQLITREFFEQNPNTIAEKGLKRNSAAAGTAYGDFLDPLVNHAVAGGRTARR